MEHLRYIWRARWLVLLASAVVAGAVYFVSAQRTAVWRVDATVDVLNDVVPGEGSVTQEEVDIVTGRFAAVARSTSVLEGAIDDANLDISVSTARDRVSAAPADESPGFVDISAEGPTAEDATALAEGVLTFLTTTSPLVNDNVRVVAQPDDPVQTAPTPSRDALFAFVLALVINAEIAALGGTILGRLTPGREQDELERLAGAPVLALVPRRRKAWVGEAFRGLRASLDLARVDRPMRTVALVGARPDSGASFVAFGLAQASANLKQNVLLVDANLRRPILAETLGLPCAPGLSDAIRGEAPGWDELPQANPLQRRFRILPAGSDVADPPGLLSAGALQKILGKLDEAELVIVDSAPLGESSDPLIIASQCDGVILVVDAARTRSRTITEARKRLDRAGTGLIGTVLNRVSPDDRTRPPRRRLRGRMRRRRRSEP